MPNEYEENARTKKVDQMVAAIDRAAIARGMDVYEDAGSILSSLMKYTNESWAIVDRVAKLKSKSSDKTRCMVLVKYKERAENAPF